MEIKLVIEILLIISMFAFVLVFVGVVFFMFWAMAFAHPNRYAPSEEWEDEENSFSKLMGDPKSFCLYLKASQLFRAYWQGLDYISTELKTALMREEKSVMKSRKKIVILRISKMIRVTNWRKLFRSHHAGLNLFCGLDWIERYLGDICKELSFEIQYKLKFEKEKWDSIIDTSRFKQFHGDFKTQFIAKENIFFEVFTSLVLSGIDPFDQKVVIMVDGESDCKVSSLEKFVGNDVWPITKTVRSSVFTNALVNSFGERKYVYRIFLEKLNP